MSFEKITIQASELIEALTHFKNNPEFDMDRLNTIICVDLGTQINQFEVIYDLNSTQTAQSKRVSVLLDRNTPHIPSVVQVYKSAYFDECEIYDLFGVIFDNNPNLKRLLMPNGWVGHPLRKDYKQDDERLLWNEK